MFVFADLWLRILVCFLDREHLGFAADGFLLQLLFSDMTCKKGEMLAELMPRYVIGIEKP